MVKYYYTIMEEVQTQIDFESVDPESGETIKQSQYIVPWTIKRGVMTSRTKKDALTKVEAINKTAGKVVAFYGDLSNNL